jgi:hypothetical protein
MGWVDGPRLAPTVPNMNPGVHTAAGCPPLPWRPAATAATASFRRFVEVARAILLYIVGSPKATVKVLAPVAAANFPKESTTASTVWCNAPSSNRTCWRVSFPCRLARARNLGGGARGGTRPSKRGGEGGHGACVCVSPPSRGTHIASCTPAPG